MVRFASLRLTAETGILRPLLADLLRRTLAAACATYPLPFAIALTSPPRGFSGPRLRALLRGFGIDDSDALPGGEGSCELAGSAGGEASGGGPIEATRELAGGGARSGRRTGAGTMTMSACGDGGSPAFLCFTTGVATGSLLEPGILLARIECLPDACDAALARGGIV